MVKMRKEMMSLRRKRLKGKRLFQTGQGVVNLELASKGAKQQAN